MIQPITDRYLDALAEGNFETWTKDTAMNPRERFIVNYQGKRFDVDTRKQLTVKELIEQNFKRTR